MFSNHSNPPNPTSRSLTSFFLSPIPKARPATEYKPSDTTIPFPFRSLCRRRHNSQHLIPSLGKLTREPEPRTPAFQLPFFRSSLLFLRPRPCVVFTTPLFPITTTLQPRATPAIPTHTHPSTPPSPFHTSLSNHTNLHDPRLKQESCFPPSFPFLSSPLPPLLPPLTAFPFTSLRCRPRITRWVGRYQRCS